MLIEHLAFSGIPAAVLCTGIIFSKKKISESDRFLIFWLLVCSINIAYYLYSPFIPLFLQSLGFTLPVLSTSVLFLYVTSLTFNLTFKSAVILRNILPYAAYNLLFVWVHILDGKIHFNYGIPGFSSGNHSVLLGIITAPMAIVPVVYIVLCFTALKRYQRLLPEFYSFSEKINLNWLKYTLLSLIGLFILIYGIIFISTRFNFISLNKTFTIVAAIQSIFLLVLVFFSIRQSLIIGYTVIPETDINTLPKNSKPDEKLDELAKQLLVFMEDKKPYLTEELSLYTLAKDLNISTNLLSQIINQNLDTNFFKFINSYRIQEVKKMLKDPSFHHYSILGIAYEAGFNSKSTFNKIFKEETGMTPSEFRKS